MIQRNHAGISIKGSFLQTRKVKKALDLLRSAAPLEHSLIKRHMDSIQIINQASAYLEDQRTMVMHQNNINSHHVWVSSWVLRFAAEQEGYTPKQQKQIQINAIKKMLMNDKDNLSIKELKFLEECTKRV